MTQNYGPYQPPDPSQYAIHYGQDPRAQMLIPARRAALLMFVLGGIGLAMGACMGFVSALPFDQLQPEQQRQLAEIERVYGVSLRILLIVSALVAAIPSLLMILLAFFVRRGSKLAIYASMGLVALMLVLTLLQLVGIFGGGSTAAQVAFSGCITVMMLSLLILIMTWLIQATRSAPLAAQAQAAYSEQYWRHMQQQQIWQTQQANLPGAQLPPAGQTPITLPPRTQSPPPPPPQDQPDHQRPT